MKLGIFGDSFVAGKMNKNLSWVEIISRKYETVGVHGLSGTNLYYSIENIKKYHEQYDKIILVSTLPGRLKLATYVSNIDPKTPYMASISVVEVLKAQELKKANPDQIRLRELDAAYNYFIFLQDLQYEQYIHYLMLDDVKLLRPDIIIINGFEESSRDKNNPSNNIDSITKKENKHWGFDSGWISWNTTNLVDTRNCHMTDENNIIFASKVEQWINGEPVLINLDEFVTPDNKDFYLIKND
jgi:hypothetical protein